MKKGIQNIISGVGLGDLKFGLSKAQVEAIMGEPEEVETSDAEDEAKSETWHYDKQYLSMSFDEEEDWKLVAISVSSDFYEFEGEKLIGLKKSDLLSKLSEIGVEDLVLEDTITEGDVLLESYFSDEKSMSFWLEDGAVADVQWTILFIDEDTIDWPV